METDNRVQQDRKGRVIVQSGTAPYRMECWSCGHAWNPQPALSGPNKGEHTEASLDREANAHFKQCKK